MSSATAAARTIAVIGLAGRFPGARNVDEYWRNLRGGVESITRLSERDLVEAGIDPATIADPRYVRAAPLLADADRFDAALFGYIPREAETMDPQHRVFLETAWEALEHAGYDAEQYSGDIGVYAGAALNTYLLYSGLLPRLSHDYLLTLTGNDKDFLATRASYKLNLTGPSLTVQCGCSTSLVAVHLACQGLFTHDCDIALAGGVSVRVPLRAGYRYTDGSLFSPDGHCRAFDASARGTLFGSGVGVVVLKRLVDALADRDTIHAVILGSAINNDGASKVSYTAPSVERQSAVIAEALAAADVEADTISYVEAHGTGTELGDPIELAALTRAFRLSTNRSGYCAIGSVKTNIGHLDAAAGVAGLIKTILALEHREIPASLHCERPNPAIDFVNSPFFVNSDLRQWEAEPRRAGVTALGVGGTNAHVILEQASPRCGGGPAREAQLLVMSAATATALDAVSATIADVLQQMPTSDLADAAYTLAVGRRSLAHRRILVCRTARDAAAALAALDRGQVHTVHDVRGQPDIAFMFPGQGTQRVNMARELYESEPCFREEVDRCAYALKSRWSIDVREALYPAAPAQSGGLDDPTVAQTALFTVEYALAKLLMSFGIQPAALIGHSAGEVVAACLAGVFSLEDALKILVRRGQFVAEQERGAMLAVSLSASETERLLADGLSIAAINAERLSVVSGPTAAVIDLQHRLERDGIHARLLATSHAYHSEMMEPIMSRLTEVVSSVARQAPQIPIASTVTGNWIAPDELTDPSYWARHLRQCVRFSAALQPLLESPNRILLEVGPGHTLASLAARHPARRKEQVVLSTLRHHQTPGAELESLLAAAGRLWLSGASIDWAAFYRGQRRGRVPLPTYPFERIRFWHDASPSTYADLSARQLADPVGFPLFEETDRATVTILQPDSDQAPDDHETVGRRSAIEKAIAGIWTEVMGLAGIDVHDNFYDLGGHSLLIPPIISRINQTFGVELVPLTLVGAPTVAQLADCIEDVGFIERTPEASGFPEAGGPSSAR